MTKVKAFLHKSKNARGEYPLTIRVTQGNDSFYKYIGERIPLEAWNPALCEVNEQYKPKTFSKETQANFKRLNAKLKSEELRISKIVLDLESDNKQPTLAEIKNVVVPPTPKQLEKIEQAKSENDTQSFIKFANGYFETMKEGGHFNQWTAERPALNHFKRFLIKKQKITLSSINENLKSKFQSYLQERRIHEKVSWRKKYSEAIHFKNFMCENVDVKFNEMDLKMMEDFKAYLNQLKKGSEEVINSRTVINQLIVLRTIYNRAIANHLIASTFSPFTGNFLKLKRPQSKKKGLVVEEIKQLEAIKLSDPSSHHARNLFLFSFYTAGMRASDLFSLKWKDINRGRLHYTMLKNNKSDSIILDKKALKILKIYEKTRMNKLNEEEYIFPELKEFKDTANVVRKQILIHDKLAEINASLKAIGEELGFKIKLTMHIARHSFATISGGKIPIQLLQQLYRHSDINVTVNYMKGFVTDETDNALEKVLDY